MVEPTPASPTPPATPSPAPAPAPVAASPTPPTETAPAAAPSGEVSRPDWLPETLWDAEKKAPKGDDLKGIFDRVKAEDERKAAIPAKVEDYKAELAPEIKLPEGWEIKPDHPMWEAGKKFAHENGLTQDQLGKLAGLFVQNQIEQHNAVAEAAKQRDASLGANGGARVQALNTWFKGVFGDQVGAQFASALFTKDMVEGFEKMQAALTSGGVTSFSNIGRQGQPPAGQIPGYDKMTPEQRWAAIDDLKKAS